MNLEIRLAMQSSIHSGGQDDTGPIYAMGNKLVLDAQFKNCDEKPVTLDNPKTSQSTLLLFTNLADEELNEIELNPGFVDITGEMTAPESSDVTLAPGEDVILEIDLHKHVVDYSLLPGQYLVQVEYDGMRSQEFFYSIKFLAESKQLLMKLAVDESEEYWIRRQAVDYLKEHHQGPNILLPADVETEVNKATRIEINQKLAAKYNS